MSGDGSFQSASLSSSLSKSLGSSEGLSSTLSNTEADPKQSNTGSSTRSKGSDSPGRNSITEYSLKTLGTLKNLHGQGEGPLDVINVIDVAQQEEHLPFVADGDEVLLSITTHGLQIATSGPRIVLLRVPLHEIERMVTFDDGITGNILLAVKTVQFSEIGKGNTTYSLYVYQCSTEEVGQKITRSFSHMLDQVLSSRTNSSDLSLDMKEERSI